MQRMTNFMVLFIVAMVVISPVTGMADVGGEQPDVNSIIAKVTEKYQSMKGYASKGEIITELDMSQVDIMSMPGMPQNENVKNSPLMKAALQEKQTLKHEFEIKLSRSGDYRIEWDQEVNQFVNTHGTAWSKDGTYKLKVSSPMMNQPVMEQKDRVMALAAATGVSGGAAHTIPALFYDMQNEILRSLQNKKLLDDDTVDGKACYVISGNLMNQAMTVWIDKEQYLVLKRKQVIGDNGNMMANMSDEEIKEGLKAVNQETTPENIAKFKEQMKGVSSMMSKMKGEIVETHSDIQVNPELNVDDFVPESEKE